MPAPLAAKTPTHVMWMSKPFRRSARAPEAAASSGPDAVEKPAKRPQSSVCVTMPEIASGRNGPRDRPSPRDQAREPGPQKGSSKSKEVVPLPFSSVPDGSAVGVPSHTLPIESGGLTLADLKREMQSDSLVQDEALPLLLEILEATVERNDSLKATRRQDMLCFEGPPAPLSVRDYTKRILKYGATATSLIIGLMYMERLKARRRNLRLTSTNYQRLLLVAVMEASKFIDDDFHSNSRWSEIGDVCLYDLNNLELEFLFSIEFDLGVQTEDYKLFLRKLIGIVSEDEPAAAAAAPPPPAAAAEDLSDALSESGTVGHNSPAVNSPAVPGAQSSEPPLDKPSARSARPNPWEVDTTEPEVLMLQAKGLSA